MRLKTSYNKSESQLTLRLFGLYALFLFNIFRFLLSDNGITDSLSWPACVQLKNRLQVSRASVQWYNEPGS